MKTHLLTPTVRVWQRTALALAVCLWATPSLAKGLTLEQAEQLALSNEPGLIAQHWRVQSLQQRAIADKQLNDPKLQLGLLNLPTDSFDLDQEPMTQLKASYIQQFPGGDTLRIKQDKALNQAEKTAVMMAQRRLKILQKVRLSYIELAYLHQALVTVNNSRTLFLQLVEISESLFSLGRQDQQDLIRAELGLTRLDERENKIQQKIAAERNRLSRWIGLEASQQPLLNQWPRLQQSDFKSDRVLLSQQLQQHPDVQDFDWQLALARNEIELVEASLEPGWGLNLSYAHRLDAPNGTERADFISAVVTFDLPYFSENRQDRQRLAREHHYQALKNQRNERLRQMLADIALQQDNLSLLRDRQQLYQNQILPQSAQQEQAALLSYQSDQGLFADVMRAALEHLNAQLEERRIAADSLQSEAKLLYFAPDLNPQYSLDTH